jgi:tellurite methyltransferase
MKSDRERWDSRYTENREAFPDPDPFLVTHAGIFVPGRALDLACGFGANSIFLAQRGWTVDAVDVSFSALSCLQREATKRGVSVNCLVADLDDWPLPEDWYDVALVFYFFSEAIIPRLKASMRPGALLIWATYNVRHAGVRPGMNPRYLVIPETFEGYFADLDVILYEPYSGEIGNISRVICRKQNS